MTIRELIDKLNSFPDYMKDANVYVECLDDTECEQYRITGVSYSMYNSIYLEAENINK